jgi:hypothetical protein
LNKVPENNNNKERVLACEISSAFDMMVVLLAEDKQGEKIKLVVY